MNHHQNDPRQAWARLAASARTVRDDRDTAAPYGFATRVAALALGENRKMVSLVEVFSLRALGVSCLLALSSVAYNYSLLSNSVEEELPAASDAVSVVFDLGD